MRTRHLIIAAACWVLNGLGFFSLLVATLIILGVERGGVKVGIVYGVVGLPLVLAALILSRWWGTRRAADESSRGFPILRPGEDEEI